MFLIFLLLPALGASNNGLESCIQDIRNDHLFWSAIILKYGAQPEAYPISSILNKLKIPSYSIDDNLGPTWKPCNRGETTSRNIYFVQAVELKPKVILNTLIASKFWMFRQVLVIFYSGTTDLLIFDYFYHKTHNRTVNILLVSIKESDLSIEKVSYKNPFLNRVFTSPDCKRALPNYFRNLHGYNVTVSLERTLDHRKQIGKKEEAVDGFELETAIRARNGNVIGRRPSDGKGYGSAEMPVTGILGDLYRGITVMHINSRLMSHQCLELYQSETIECSYPRASQALVAYIPHHWNEKKLLKLRLNFLSLYLLACFIILSYAISRCYRLPPLDTSILLLAVSIGQGVPHNKIRSYGLFFMMVLLIFTFLNMFWSSAMSRYLTVPCSEKITKTIKEMVDEGAYPIATFEHYKHLLSHALEQDLFLALSKRLVIVPEIQDHANNIRDARTCHNKGYIELKTYAVHMHREDYLSGRKCYTILPEALMPGWKIYSFSFGSPFLPEMNKVLSWMASAGLDEFYWREFPLDIDKEFYTARFYTLGYRFVEVAFYILFGGWAAGALVFICEQTNGRFVKKCVLWCSCWLYGFAARR